MVHLGGYRELAPKISDGIVPVSHIEVIDLDSYPHVDHWYSEICIVCNSITTANFNDCQVPCVKSSGCSWVKRIFGCRQNQRHLHMRCTHCSWKWLLIPKKKKNKYAFPDEVD
jgi:hypothetical protein